MRTHDELIQAFTNRAVAIARRKRRRRRVLILAVAALAGALVTQDVADACRWVCVAYGGKVYCQCR